MSIDKQPEKRGFAQAVTTKPIYIFKDSEYLDDDGKLVKEPLIGITVGSKDYPDSQFYFSLSEGKIYQVKPPLKKSDKEMRLPGIKELNETPKKNETQGESDAKNSDLIEVKNPVELNEVVGFVGNIKAFIETVESDGFRNLRHPGDLETLVNKRLGYVKTNLKIEGFDSVPVDFNDMIMRENPVDAFVNRLKQDTTNLSLIEIYDMEKRLKELTRKSISDRFPGPKDFQN